MPIVAPRRMTNNDVSNTPELSGGGGGLSWSPPEFRWCWSRRPILGTFQDGSVHVMIKRSGHWLARESRQVGLCLMTTFGRRAGGGGGIAPFRLMLRMHQRCLLRDFGGVCRWDHGWDAPGRECPREDRDLRPRAGVTRPAGVSVGGGNAGPPRAGGTLSSLVVAGRLPPVVPAGGSSPVGAANPAGPDGLVVAGGTLSPLFHEVLGPL